MIDLTNYEKQSDTNCEFWLSIIDYIDGIEKITIFNCKIISIVDDSLIKVEYKKDNSIVSSIISKNDIYYEMIDALDFLTDFYKNIEHIDIIRSMPIEKKWAWKIDG